MPLIIGIDPGSTASAFVVLDIDTLRLLDYGWKPNQEMADWLSTKPHPGARLVIEKVCSYGRPAGDNLFETVRWTGHFEQAYGQEAVRITQPEVRVHFCRTAQAKYANIKAVLYDRFGGDRKAALGTKKRPGPLFGLKGDDVFAALAVAMCAAERLIQFGSMSAK